MKIEAVIFDLDGVIVHTDKFHYKAWKTIADKLGVYFDEEINDRLRGVSRSESLEIILERYRGPQISKAEKQRLAEEKNGIYREMLREMEPEDVSPDVRSTLEKIRGLGYLTAIGSSSKNAKFILNQVEMADWFDAIADGNDISRTKPDPEVFLKAAEFLQKKPENCLVVEDAEAGIKAGKAGGMLTAAVGAAVRCHMADYKLTSFEGLLDILSAKKA